MKNGLYELVIAPIDYPGRLYQGKYCYEHHLVWWRMTGKIISKSEVIHHTNGDKRDNRFKNLERLTNTMHKSKHALSRGRAMVKLRCPTCRTVFDEERRKTQLVHKKKRLTFCSRVCVGKFNFYKASKEKIAEAEAINIIEVFRQYPDRIDQIQTLLPE